MRISCPWHSQYIEGCHKCLIANGVQVRSSIGRAPDCGSGDPGSNPGHLITPDDRTPEREAFLAAFIDRMRYVEQTLEATLRARLVLDRHGSNAVRETAYAAEQIRFEGAACLLGEVLYDVMEAGVESAILLNITPARLATLTASVSTSAGRTSSPGTAQRHAGGDLLSPPHHDA